jgi:carboxylesterase
MRLLGEHLQEKGYTVMGVRLSGHGTWDEQLAQTHWPQWYNDVEDGYQLLTSICGTVAVVGLSMGGLLALKLASEYPLNRVVAINAPIYIADDRLPFLPICRFFIKFISKKRRKLPVEGQYNVGYDRIPLDSLYSLTQLIKQSDSWLPLVAVPTLLIQSRHDNTILPQSAQYIYNRLVISDKQLVWLEHSGHVATIGAEYRHVFAEVTRFLKKGA